MRMRSVPLLSIPEIYQCRPLLLLLHFTLLRISNNVFVFKTIAKQVLFIDLLLEERKVLGLEVGKELRD